ncbi:MAG: leucine-rich repeat domain-containing protein, partial [bacterium]
MSKDLELVQQIEKESGMQLKQLQQLDQNTNQRGYVLNTDRMVTSLQLDQIRLNDWSFLQGLTSLTSLYLSDNKISDYSFLQGLTNLTSLDLSNNKISDYSFLQGLTNLTSLD